MTSLELILLMNACTRLVVAVERLLHGIRQP